MFGASARALVHPDNIEPGRIGFRGNAVDVMGVTASLEPMQQKNGLSRPAVALPMTEPDELSIRIRGKHPTFNRNTGEERSSRPIPRDERHEMAIAKETCRDEGWNGGMVDRTNRRTMGLGWSSRHRSSRQDVETPGRGIAGRAIRPNMTPRASSQEVMMVVIAITMMPLANCV